MDEAIDRLAAYKLGHSELTTEEAVVFLQQDGFSKIESIGAISKMFGKPISETKSLVHFSTAWAFRRQNDDDFHEDLVENLEALNDVASDTQPGHTL